MASNNLANEKQFLIVDDSLADARVIETLLKKACPDPFGITHANSSSEGLSQLAERHFDCVFLDYRLEDSSDWDSLERIRASGNDVPIIAISGNGNEHVAVESLKLGAQDYLVKGTLTVEAVQRALSNAIEKVTLARKLAVSMKELQEFTQIASHDLQAPLRRIAQLSQFLREDLGEKLDDQSSSNLRMIDVNARRLLDLVRSLITYARQGSFKNPGLEVHLGDAVRSAMENLDVVVQETDAKIEVGDLPTVAGDQTTLVSLFQNLLSNAIKFRGQSRPEVRIDARQVDSHWLISVGDNGIGISQENLQRIFTPFHRLHSQSEVEGSGIGLATCKKIVQQHGGSIWAESEPGQGTTFCISLPELVPVSA
ncbi:response regulator [bacterium]|nr:response regulator [bacterium]